MFNLDPASLGNQSIELARKLSLIKKQLDQLNIPQTIFMGIHINKDFSFEVAELGGQKYKFHSINPKNADQNTLIQWLKEFQHTHQVKIIAVGLGGRHRSSTIMSKLWLELDIVPHFITQPTHNSKADLMQTARIAQSLFDIDGSAKPVLGEFNQVDSSYLVSLKDYQDTVDQKTWKEILKYKKLLKNKKVVFFSATPQGGGVAIMRHAMIRLYRLLDIDIKWHILYDNTDVFSITKTKFHNVLQAVADPKVVINQEDMDLFNTWSAENAQTFKPVIQAADVIVIDDPQPSGMIPFILKWNPQAKLLYRSHIQIQASLVDKPDTPQYKTWEFLWKNIKHCQTFIAHPIRAFVPQIVPRESVVLMPPTADPLDGLNKPLSPDQEEYYLKIINKYLIETNQEPIDLNRAYITQVARFDPSKGIPDVIDAYIKLCDKLPKSKRPQLVIAGHGSIDDPDGVPIYNLLRDLLKQDDFKDYQQDIKIVRIHHIDQPLNALVRRSHVVLQLSHKEGFEFKVTEGLMKGKPVVGSNAGGIPLQIIDGKTGYIVNVGDTEAVVDKLYQLFTDKKLYKKLSNNAINADFIWVQTVQNALNWLYLSHQALQGRTDGNFAPIPNLANPGIDPIPNA